jgi:hypothetical protein
MDEPLAAHSFNEVRYFLMVSPCPQCGRGPLEIEDGFLPETAPGPMHVPVICKSCHGNRTLEVRCDFARDEADPLAINPDPHPSRIIDLTQWLSLFYLLVESASAEASRPAVREMGYQAALCLAEALKFYSDNELPPETAFFSNSSRATFREHPGNFARQKLRDMQAKLPDLGAMARRLQRDSQRRPSQWWRFWRR